MLNQDAIYRVSQSLSIQISSRGKLLATSSALSRDPKELGPEGIPVLQVFAGGNTIRGALSALAEEWDLEESGFSELVETLVQHRLLVPQSADGSPGPQGGFADISAQHFMVRDTVRVMAYRAAIAAHAPGRSVVEVGCGTGILSLFAAQAGARRVVAIEETAIADLAREMVRANGFGGIVEVISGNSRDVALDEPGELLIHEILGTDPFAENLLPFIEDARERFLIPGGRLIPDRLEILCAGLHVEDPPRTITRDQALREGRELAALYGLDLSPYLRAVERVPRFRRPLTVPAGDFPHPVLSGEHRLYDLDLAAGDLASAASEPAETNLEITTAGELTSLVLYFRAHLDERTCLTTSPFAPKTHWGWMVRDLSRTIAVRPGDRVPIDAQVETIMGRQMLRVDLA